VPRKLPLRVLLLKTNPDFEAALEDPVANFQDFPDHTARLYWQVAHESTPKWVTTIFAGQGLDGITTKTASAVLLIKAADHMFAVTFGYGKSLLKASLVESRFGLKVVLNRVDPKNLRSVDAKSLDGSLGHKREQLPVLSSLTNFGIDIEKDFLRAVTGLSKDETIGKTISGSEAFCASVGVDLQSMSSLLAKLLAAFEEQVYKENFEFIDNISEVPSALTDSLNEKLVERIKAGNTEGIWLAAPDIIDWEDSGRFSFNGMMGRYEDVYLEAFLEDRVKDLTRLKIGKLKHEHVILLNADETTRLKQWTVFKCVYADIEDGGKHFVLSDGKWFEVDSNYIHQVKTFLDNNLDEVNVKLPIYNSQLMATTDASGLRGEARYNALAASENGYSLLDRQMIIHGGANSKIELCDLYGDNLFIHIKRYTRSSGLSHLFNQGSVSADLLMSDLEFRIKAAEKITESGGNFENSGNRPDPQNISVVFGVVSASQGNLKLPFFSQVALKNAVKFMKNTLQIGKVGLVKIQATKVEATQE
jgi:uncharacterized protein (TIGR04141 family)